MSLKPLVVSGDKRFKCECGAVMSPTDHDDAGAAIEHTMHGHKVAIEEFRNGRWRYSVGDSGPKLLTALIMERMRVRGESIPALIRRLNEESERIRVSIEHKERDKVN